MRTLYLAAAVVVLAASFAQASITVEAYWRGGEEEGKSVGDTWANLDPVQDSSGNSVTLRARAEQGVIAAGSSASDKAGSTVAYYRNTIDQMATTTAALPMNHSQNWGIEAWVMSEYNTATREILMIGRDTWDRGVILDQEDGAFFCRFPGTGIASNDGGNAVSIPVVEDQWVHIAVVNEDGVNTMYADGVSVGSWNGSPDTSTYSSTYNPMVYNRIGWSVGNENYFVGGIDEVRVFTFESGQFQTSDLLIPEPATVGLLGVGGLALLRRRR